MRPFAKRQIQWTLGKVGYRVVRLHPDEDNVIMRFDEFSELVRAYEGLLNGAHEGGQIPADESRARLLSRLLGTPVTEAYFIVQALAETAAIPGDVCEFGVARGDTSALIANELRHSEKTLHLFDSFAGLPAPTEKDRLKDDIFRLGSIEAYTGTMSFPEEAVLDRLREIGFPSTRYVIHKGMVDRPIQAGGAIPERVSCAYVDFDFYEPIKFALDYLHEVTSPGAVVVADDYDFFSAGAKAALDEFIAERNSKRQIYDLTVADERYGHFAVLRRRGRS